VGQLLQTPDDELLRMRNFGKKSLDEIKERLAASDSSRTGASMRPRAASEEPAAEDETEAETSVTEGEET
jgi:DNA-directed RNA polymerase alpha subunit